MPRSLLHVLLILATMVWVAPEMAIAQSTTGKRMTPELLWQLGRLGEADYSPELESVVFSVRHYDLAANSGRSTVSLVGLDGQAGKTLLKDVSSASSLQWVNTAHGTRLFYLAPGEGDNQPSQVWSLDPDSGAKTQVTRIESGVGNLKVSPTGRQLAFTVDVKMDATVNELYEDLPKADARIIDGLMFRHWDQWHDYKYSHLHVASLNDDGTAGEARDLMHGLRADCPLPPFGGAEKFAWSPDGRQIACTLKLVNNWAESTDSDVYLFDVTGATSPECITHGMNGYDNDPVYSPDGRYLAFHSMQRPSFEADRNRIMLFDRADGKISELTVGLDQTAHGTKWSADSKRVYFVSEHRGTNQVFTIDLSFPGQAGQVTRGWFNWDLVEVLPDDRLLVSRQSMVRPAELAVVDSSSGDATQLTSINDSIYEGLELPKVEQRWVRASDGQMIHNWVILPPDFDPQKKWPMLTYCQGGPQGQIGQWFSYRWNFHLMASQGYVVLAVNRRGLPGFGQAWNDQISRDWGGQAMQDILAATDSMMAESYIDAQRLGAVGASFGGYTVYWLMGHHEDRFQTMIAHCGVFNLESMYGSTEELFFVNWDMGGPYWKSAAVQADYDRFSPHRFVRNWKTPLLVIHGEKDFRVPVTQGMEAFTAAQVQGVPSRFLYFPNEGHWVQSPQNGVLWHRVFFDWLDKSLK